MKKLLIFLATTTLGLLLLSSGLLYSERGQDLLLRRGAMAVMSAAYVEYPVDALRIYVCGSSSPLPDPQRAQACVVILTPEHFYVVDSGAGSTMNLIASRLPLKRLNGVLLTHFHSDHIAELYELNLNSWIQGRAEPLAVYGPDGVSHVVDGLNLTYQQDVQYRVEHHGADLLPPALGKLVARTIDASVIIEHNGLKVTSFVADHQPVFPAVGYRIDYKGRSVVITGDTIITSKLEKVAEAADLLLSDALSMPIINTLADAATAAGLHRNAKILKDVRDYHAHVADVIEMSVRARIKLTGLYHLVPPPANIVMENIYKRNLPDNVILTQDRMWFTLEVGDDEVNVDFP
jgi:ribonuclease Z